MAFTPKDWKDAPDGSTPLSASALENMETRLAAYTDQEITSLEATVVTTTRADRLISIAADATEEEIQAVFTDLVDFDRVVFLGSSHELSEPLAIRADYVRIDARRTHFLQTGYKCPVFDVGNSEGVDVEFDLLEYDDPDNRWTFADEYIGDGRGANRNNFCCGIWTGGARGRFKGRVKGFQAAAFAIAYNLSPLGYRPEGDRLYGNHFDLEVEDVAFGVLANGQEAMSFDLRGRYNSLPGCIHPPHLLYVTSGRSNLNGRGKGHAWDSTGTGNIFCIGKSGTVSGGTFALTVNGNATAGITANATTTGDIVAKVEATDPSLVGKVIAHYHDGSVALPFYPTNTSPGWYLIFDRTLGQMTVTINDAGVTGGGDVLCQELQPPDSGGPWRWKQQWGGFYDLTADNCPSSLEIYETSRDMMIRIQSLNDIAPGGGSIVTDTTVSNIIVTSAQLKMGKEVRAVNLRGTDNTVRGLSIDTEIDGATSQSLVVVRDTRNTVEVEELNNRGTGHWYGVSVWSGEGHHIKTRRMRNISVGVQLAAVGSAATGCTVDVDPKLITFAAGTEAFQLPWKNDSGVTTNKFKGSALRRKLPGILLPQSPGWLELQQAPTAQRAYFQRIVTDDWLLMASICWRVLLGAGANDDVEVGIHDDTGAAIWQSGLTAGKLNATGVQSISVPAAYRYLPPDTPRYIGFWTPTPGGTACQIAMANVVTAAANGAGAWNTRPDADGFSQSSVSGGLPNDMSSTVTGAGAVPVLWVRET